jgi:hypothetical protein
MNVTIEMELTVACGKLASLVSNYTCTDQGSVATSIDEGEKEIIILLTAVMKDYGVDAAQAALETALSIKFSGLKQNQEYLKFSKSLIAVTRNLWKVEPELRRLASEEDAGKLLDYIEANAKSISRAECLIHVREHICRFGITKESRDRLGLIIDKGELCQKRGDGKNHEYQCLIQQMELLFELAKYVQRAQRIMAVENGMEPPVGSKPWRLVQALSVNDSDNVRAMQVLKNPLNVWQPLSDITQLLCKMDKKHPIYGVALAITKMSDAGLTALPLVLGNDSAPLKILKQLRSYPDGYEPVIDKAIEITRREAFARLDDAAAQWRDAWHSICAEGSGSDPALACRIMNEFLNEDHRRFLIQCIENRISPSGRLLLEEAQSLRRAAEADFHDGILFDGGLVCLAYFRVVEVEMNHVVRNMMHAVTDIGEDSQNDFEKSLGKKLRKLCAGDQGELTFGELRQYFGILKRELKGASDTSWAQLAAGARASLTESGMAAAAAGEWSKLISDDVCRKYRNPPAHTSFLDWEMVGGCIDVVVEILVKLFGYGDASGPRDGWVGYEM